MRSSSEKDLTVYDFDEGEAAIEAASGKYTARFKSRSVDDALNKYSFLQAFSSGTEMKQTNVEGIMCIDMHEGDDDDVTTHYTAGSGEANFNFSSGLVEIAANYSGHSSGLLTALVSGDNYEMDVNMVSDEEEESSMSRSESPSTTCSDVPENDGYFGHEVSDGYYDTSFGEVVEKEGEVIIRPDYVMCGTSLYVEPLLTFSPDGIKIECTDSNGDEGKIFIQWELSQVVHIDCKFTHNVVGGASMRILIRANPEAECEKSRFVRVSFLASDFRWPEKEQKIRNFASRYQEIWNSIPIDDAIWEEECTDSALFFPKYYFSGIADNFEDVIYPKGDPDAVSISKRDIELLLPETFINDTIIDFYIKYLNNKIPSNERQRYHFFNSFFFRKLADLDKEPGKTPDGRAAFQRVRKWTRKLNLFDKDYIFIPVNFNLHWSLLVICHPGEITKLGDDELKELPKVPCILHMDSLKGSHTGLKNIIQSYLWEEWKERNPQLTEDYSPKFLNLRFVTLELPQQENSFDCGLFLLHYVELFLEDAPINFNPFKITKFSSFLTPDWFPPADGSLKRSLIRKLIYSLLNETSSAKESDPTVSDTANCFGNYQDNNDNGIVQEPCVQFLSEPCCPAGPATDLAISNGGNNGANETGIHNEANETGTDTEANETVETDAHNEANETGTDNEANETVMCEKLSQETSVLEDEEVPCSSQGDDREEIYSPLDPNNDATCLTPMQENEANCIENNTPCESPDQIKDEKSDYVPDTPIISSNEVTNTEVENEKLGFVSDTPIVSCDEVERETEKPNVDAKEVREDSTSEGISVISDEEGDGNEVREGERNCPKKRKLVTPESSRRVTRSCARGCTS